jgi:hypothetical protein
LQFPPRTRQSSYIAEAEKRSLSNQLIL